MYWNNTLIIGEVHLHLILNSETDLSYVWHPSCFIITGTCFDQEIVWNGGQSTNSYDHMKVLNVDIFCKEEKKNKHSSRPHEQQ